MRPHEIHVVPGPPNPYVKGRIPWGIKEGGLTLAFCVTKAIAIRVGRALAREKKTSLRIHGRDGEIKSERSYGNETKRPG